MTDPTRLLIIEDHELLAHSLGMALRAEGYQVHVSALVSLDGIIAEAGGLQPHAVLLDLDLGGAVGDGVGLIEPLTRAGARVVVVTGSTEGHRHGMCLEQGAVAVLDKRVSYDRLLAVVVAVAEGRDPMDSARRHSLLAELRSWRSAHVRRMEPFERLTPREKQVLGGLLEGRSAEVIARDWVVSETTVRTQIRGVLTKLGVSSQLSAVAAARSAGWSLEAGEA
jgi:two-component system nitrate/nitrite response regulator NarL